MQECEFTAFDPERLVDLLGGGVEVEQRQAPLLGDSTHRLGEVPEGFADLPLGVEATPGDGGHEHGLATLRLNGVDVGPQAGRVGCESAHALPFLLLVVMPELDEHEVAGAQLGENLVKRCSA